jgi:hypothetical protein
MSVRLAPAATAAAQRPMAMLSSAACTATSDDEQAVSMVTAGPRRPKV